MRLRRWFRSPYVPRFSETPVPVNVPGWLNRHHPGYPGYRQENRRYAIPSAYSFRLSGRAPACILAGYALSARPCASPRPSGNASAIFSRTREPLQLFRLPKLLRRFGIRVNFWLCEQPSRASLDTQSAKRYLLATPAKSGVRISLLYYLFGDTSIFVSRA